MSGIAEVLLNLGYQISGSDLKLSATTQRLRANPGRYSWAWPPSRHQRKPSITPTIGLSEYIRRHWSGTIAELNPTGDTYKPNCTINGMT